jgi:hypothetical protein
MPNFEKIHGTTWNSHPINAIGIKVSRIPSEPVDNPHDYEEDLDDIIIDPNGDVIGTYIH